jgi:hypothetical protein
VANTFSAYLGFLAKHPDGGHAALARSAVLMTSKYVSPQGITIPSDANDAPWGGLIYATVAGQTSKIVFADPRHRGYFLSRIPVARQ